MRELNGESSDNKDPLAEILRSKLVLDQKSENDCSTLFPKAKLYCDHFRKSRLYFMILASLVITGCLLLSIISSLGKIKCLSNSTNIVSLEQMKRIALIPVPDHTPNITLSLVKVDVTTNELMCFQDREVSVTYSSKGRSQRYNSQ